MGEIAEPRWGTAIGAGVLALLVTLIVVSIAYSAWMPGTGMLAWMWVWMLVLILLVIGLSVPIGTRLGDVSRCAVHA